MTGTFDDCNYSVKSSLSVPGLHILTFAIYLLSELCCAYRVNCNFQVFPQILDWIEVWSLDTVFVVLNTFLSSFGLFVSGGGVVFLLGNKASHTVLLHTATRFFFCDWSIFCCLNLSFHKVFRACYETACQQRSCHLQA